MKRLSDSNFGISLAGDCQLTARITTATASLSQTGSDNVLHAARRLYLFLLLENLLVCTVRGRDGGLVEAMWLLLCAWQAMQPSKWQIGEIIFFFKIKLLLGYAAGENNLSVFKMTTSDASSGIFIDHIAWAYPMYLRVYVQPTACSHA